jgi:hypothetical protein
VYQQNLRQRQQHQHHIFQLATRLGKGLAKGAGQCCSVQSALQQHCKLVYVSKFGLTGSSIGIGQHLTVNVSAYARASATQIYRCGHLGMVATKGAGQGYIYSYRLQRSIGVTATSHLHMNPHEVQICAWPSGQLANLTKIWSAYARSTQMHRRVLLGKVFVFAKGAGQRCSVQSALQQHCKLVCIRMRSKFGLVGSSLALTCGSA